MAELKNYLQGRLMLDPSLDGDELIHRFLLAYYGAPSAPFVFEYMTGLHNATLDPRCAGDVWPPCMYDDQPPTAYYLDPHTLIAAMAALNSGRAAAVTNPDMAERRKFVERADRLKLSLWYVALRRWDELYANATASGLAWPWPESNRTTYRQLRSIFYLNGWENFTLRYGFDINASLPPVTPTCNVDCFGQKLGFLPVSKRPPLKVDDDAQTIMPVVVLNASAPELTAARRLQRYLAQISGGDVPLHRSGSSHGASHFAVGYFATLAAGVDVAALDGLGDDDFVVSSNRSAALRAGSVALSGRLDAPRGAIYAVFDYLRLLGCEWYAIDEVKVPSTLPSPLPMVDKVHRVPIRIRDTDQWPVAHSPDSAMLSEGWSQARQTEWATALGFNGAHHTNNISLGGNVNYASPPGPVHTSYRFFRPGWTSTAGPPPQLWRDHPEWAWPRDNGTSCKDDAFFVLFKNRFDDVKM